MTGSNIALLSCNAHAATNNSQNCRKNMLHHTHRVRKTTYL
jgi:hypothetical protein